MPRKSLTTYKIREEIAGEPVTDLSDPMKEEYLNGDQLEYYDLDDGFDFDARLFLWLPDEREPAWADLLREGFQGIEIPKRVTNRAVLVIRINYYQKDRYFAFTLGAGRHLLKSNGYERNYGLRTALNVIYEGDDPTADAPLRVRRIDAKTVAANTFRTRRQANRYTTFEAFGVDIQQDLLGAVTGVPANSDTWGTRIGGADPVYLNVELAFSDLGDWCRRIWRTERGKDYRARFEWIDNITVVSDTDIVDRLEAAALTVLQEGSSEDLGLAPPELWEWDELDHFRYTCATDREYPDLDLHDYLQLLTDLDKLEDLTLNTIKRTHRVEAVDEDGEVIGNWPIFRCVDGEIELDGKTYLLVEGDFFEVAES